jgi:hypothetical protein
LHRLLSRDIGGTNAGRYRRASMQADVGRWRRYLEELMHALVQGSDAGNP